MMKKLNFILMVVSLALTVSCAEENKKSSSVPTVTIPAAGTPYIPPSFGPGLNAGTLYGGNAAITISSLSRMSEYTGRAMNAPQDIKLNLNMVKSSGGTFGGTARITYTDIHPYTGVRTPFEGYFTAGSSADATSFNRLFSINGKTVWHGNFEDFLGGLVIVIDEIVDLGDGQGPQDTVNGSIWFKNFGLTYAPHSPTYCWFISLGPYDCRGFPSGDSMNTYQSIEPTNGYVLLGRFTGMSLKAAFNNEKLQ